MSRSWERTNRFPPRPPGTTKLPDKVTIRDYCEADSIAIIELARQLQGHETQYFDRLKPPDAIGRWYLDDLLAQIRKHNGVFLVAEYEGERVGYATLLLGLTSADEPEEVLYTYAHIGDLAVASRHRGKGIGSALMAHCEKLALAAGESWLRLSVLAGNHSARGFYANVGMQETLVRLEKKLF
jgi:ribosomal protein S18 acetylase RimI-like enzyme